MIELLGLTASLLAVFWVRKQDIANIMVDKSSRSELISNIIYGGNRFNNHIENFSKFLDNIFGHGHRFFFSIFMLSLLYVSFSFTLSIIFIENKNIFFDSEINIQNARLVFSIFLSSAIVSVLLGATHNRHLNSTFVNTKNTNIAIKHLNSLKKSPSYFWQYVYFSFCGIILTVSVWIIYRSITLSIIAATLSLISSRYNLHLYPFILMRKKYFRVCIGAALGTFGLLVAALAFIGLDISYREINFIFIATTISALVAGLSMKTSTVIRDDNYRYVYRFVSPEGRIGRIISMAGRPSLFVGFHCIRASGPFSISVAIVLLNVFVARSLVPEAVASAGSVMLACIIFFSGATTLAGSGYFAFWSVVLIAVYMIKVSVTNLFTIWSPAFLFWIMLPLTNSVIDFARWHLARKNIKRFRKGRDSSSITLISIDFFLGCIAYVIYVFFTFFSLSIFSLCAEYINIKTSFNVNEIILQIKNNVFQNGIWLIFMAGTMLIPTIIQFIIFMYSGFNFLYTNGYRSKLAFSVRNASTLIEIDSIAWRVAAIDIMGRLILTCVFVLVVAFLAIQFAPLLQTATETSAQTGYDVAKYTFNWSFANE